MITGINEQKIFKKLLSSKSKCDDRKYTQTKSEITVSAGVSAKIQKNIMYAKKIIFGILLNVVAKSKNIQQVLLPIQ